MTPVPAHLAGYAWYPGHLAWLRSRGIMIANDPGNAVPPPAAAAVASVMGRAILAARAGVTFDLSYQPVWVQPIASALSLGFGLA